MLLSDSRDVLPFQNGTLQPSLGSDFAPHWPRLGKTVDIPLGTAPESGPPELVQGE